MASNSNGSKIDGLNIHGIRDFTHAANKGIKLLWALALLAALVAFTLQLQEVAQQYLTDQTSTFEEPYIPDYLPALMVCPIFRTIRPGIVFTTMEYNYLLGYLPLSQSQLIWKDGSFAAYLNQSSISRVKEVIQSFNGSLSAMMVNNSYTPDEVIPSVFRFPVSAKTKKATVFNMHGVCYTVKLVERMDWLLNDYAMIAVELKDDSSESLYSQRPGHLYDFYIGNQDTLGVQMGIREGRRINQGSLTAIRVRAKKKIRYAGRGGQRCKNYTKADYRHAVMRKVNEKGCPGVSDCKSYIPASTNEPEVKSDLYCNIYSDSLNVCPIAVINDAEIRKNFIEDLKIPCEDTTYNIEISIGQLKQGTHVEMAMDNEGLSTSVTEFPKVTTADFLSAIGGTTGLWFGASVLAIFQAILLCAAGAAGLCKKRPTSP